MTKDGYYTSGEFAKKANEPVRKYQPKRSSRTSNHSGSIRNRTQTPDYESLRRRGLKSKRS